MSASRNSLSGGGGRPLLTGFTVIISHFFLILSALRRLTEKARLLGYEVELGLAGTGEARRKIAPNLTNEFVNYFNGKFLTF